MKHQESKLQRECVKWFGLQYPKIKYLLIAIPNGGKRSIIEASIMKSEGVKAGTPDLFLAVPNKSHPGLFIEMKYGSGRVTMRQRYMIEELKKQGYQVEICRSISEFMNILNVYLT